MESLTKKPSVSGRKNKNTNEKTLWYLRGRYATVRNDDGGWFLCRIQHNVYNTTKIVKIRWLSQKTEGGVPVDEHVYELDYGDEIDPACILYNVRVTRWGSVYKLHEKDRLQTEKLLKVSVDVASGKLTVGEVESDVEEVVQMEPPTKKRKKVGKKTRDTEYKDDREPKRKVAKKNEHLILHPNSDVKIWKKDPFFETNRSVPFVSKYAHSRLLFRAVYMKDHELLRKLLNDAEKVRVLHCQRSVADVTTPLHHAIKLNNQEAISLLHKAYFVSGYNDRRRTISTDNINIQRLETGSYNVRSLGAAFIRPIMASRGVREGNNALTKDLSVMRGYSETYSWEYERYMLKSGVGYDSFKKVSDHYGDGGGSHYRCMPDCYQALAGMDQALERGHYKLVGQILRDIHTDLPRMRRFTPLHYQVLLSDKELENVSLKHITHGIKLAGMITPVHCAACNPDTQHLEKLLEMAPDVHLSDKSNRRLIHFAAGCVGTGPLDFLIKRGANIYDCDHQGNTPLHFAARANRTNNIQILLNVASSDDAPPDPCLGKFGDGGINRPNRSSYTPLHLAVEQGFLEVVKVLIKNEANINATLNTANFKVTPLILASQFGYINTTVFLVKNGAVVQQRDRLGRAAVVHAAMNGNTNILSYLLKIGASPNLGDTSGNSPLHYATAYGWYFCVKTLLEAGADVNASNDWKTTPLSIAYLKAHMGIVSLLLAETDADVNFQDDEGMTLVSIASASALYPDLYDQIHYLIKDKRALCTFKDVGDATPLHHIARNNVHFQDGNLNDAMETSVKIARLLVRHGCDHTTVDNNGSTALMDAMRTGNVKLCQYLVKNGCSVYTDLDKEGDNILHFLCNNFFVHPREYFSILKYIVKMDGKTGTQNLKKDFCDMAQVYCHHGSTALLTFCQRYQMKPCKLGRNLIKLLIEEFDSDVDAVMKENYYAREEDKPEAEYQRYQISYGKWSVVEVLTDVQHCEYGNNRKKKEPDWPALRMILKYKPNLSTRDLDGHTPLTRVLDNNKFDVAKILVKEGNADINYHCLKEYRARGGQKHKTAPLTLAALSGNISVFDLLVESGADLTAISDWDGNTVLHDIVVKGRQRDDAVKMVHTLLNRGVDVNILNRDQRTPLHLAVNENEGRMDDNFDLILAILDRGGNLTSLDGDGRTPLHYVFVKIGNNKNTRQHDPVELCRTITSRMKPEDLNIQDKFGMTALHRAAFRGANICCMYLMQKGADVNLKNNDGNTALAMAVKGGHDGCGAVLIQNGASLKDPVFGSYHYSSDSEEEICEVPKKPVWKWTPMRQKQKENIDRVPHDLFECVIDKEFQAMCFLMMEKSGEESGITFGTAIEAGLKLRKYNVVLRLLTTTADLTPLRKHLGEHGRNLLHVLSLTANSYDGLIMKVVTELLENGVSLTTEDDYKCTSLLYASFNHNFELCRLYINTPGVYNPKYTDSFHRSIISAGFWKTSKLFDVDFVSWVSDLHQKKANLNELIDRPVQDGLFGEMNSEQEVDYWEKYDCARISPLIISIHNHDQNFCQWLLKNGASVNQADSKGRTPMMHAVREDDLNIVKTLLNFQFDPNAKVDTETMTHEKEEDKTKKENREFKLKRNMSQKSKSDAEDSEDEENDEETIEDKLKEDDDERQNYQPYKKESSVNLNAVDKNGWTVMHHAICPLSFGTFDNDEIVFILAKAGAKLNMKNKKGETPLDLAVKKGAFRIARMIQELDNVNEKIRREPKYTAISVTDNLKWSNLPPSFHTDAQRFLNSLGKPMDIDEEYQAKIDSNCDVTNGTLVKDEEQELLYDVLLTKVDVNLGVWGLYNFYQMQLVHQTGKDIYILFTRWGRIGHKGQFQHTPYKVKDEAVKEFSQIFHAKTGHKWTEVKSFENKSGKYRLVHNNERRGGHRQSPVEFESKFTVKSMLPTHLQHVMQEMTNMKSLGLALKDQRFDSDIMPFSRLERDQLLNGRGLLEHIRLIVKDIEGYRYEKKITDDEDESSRLKDIYQRKCEQVGILSSEYFQLIPQNEFVFEKIRPLDSLGDLNKQIKLVNNLLDYEVASRILLGAKYIEKSINPLDYVYRSLGCQIQLLSEEDEESQYILRYIKNSYDGDDCRRNRDAQVEAIYRLKREGEQVRMDEKNLGNHRLLFHGSGVANFLSILHKGLVLAPLDAPRNGHLYGKGIYFSDKFSESSGYCSSHNRNNRTRFMLLCEVALGKCKQKYGQEIQRPGTGCDSMLVIGMNRPDDKYDVHLTTGCLLPLGHVKRGQYYKGIDLQDFSPTRFDNQYIIFDEGQVCLRYLIQYTGYYVC